MSTYVFDNVKSLMAKSQLSFYGVPDGGFKLALVTSAAFTNSETGSLSDEQYWSGVSGTEITEDSAYFTVGYTGHQDLNSVGLLEVDSGGYTQIKVSANDISFPVSKIDADGAIIYKNDTNKTLIIAIDFGEKKRSSDGVFNMGMSENGWIRIQ